MAFPSTNASVLSVRPRTAGYGRPDYSARDDQKPLSIVVVGASGDLALRKVLPALFALECQGLLPAEMGIFGFSRTALSDDGFQQRVREHLTCRYPPKRPSSVRPPTAGYADGQIGEGCADRVDRFLARCRYVAGQYDSRDAFLDLYARMRAVEGEGGANRIFYMAIPPFLFMDVARAVGGAGLVDCDDGPGWSRVVIEKPFGRDRTSSDALTGQMAQVFTEDQTYRIDHYLGKEVIQNLLVLRFANAIFEPLWNRTYVDHIRIAWQEDAGVANRGRYFDAYGIIRDVMQNHLLQILALAAMEPPAHLDGRRVRDEKVRVLRHVPPVRLEDMVLGQYRQATCDGRLCPSYVDEPGVAPDSITPTYAAAVLYVQNPRWEGVPILVTAGKGLNARKTELRLCFRKPPRSLFEAAAPDAPPNELVIRVQPDEALSLRIMSKGPGLEMALAETALDLRYAAAFEVPVPDAYECLLLDVIQGDKSLFIRADELGAAWDIFTPALHEIDQYALRPAPYDFGSAGPAAVHELVQRHGIPPER